MFSLIQAEKDLFGTWECYQSVDPKVRLIFESENKAIPQSHLMILDQFGTHLTYYLLLPGESDNLLIRWGDDYQIHFSEDKNKMEWISDTKIFTFHKVPHQDKYQ